MQKLKSLLKAFDDKVYLFYVDHPVIFHVLSVLAVLLVCLALKSYVPHLQSDFYKI